MAIEWNRFWCRVLFKEYIKHYRKMTDEEIVKDVRQSMDDLEDLVADTDTFGSQMVRWSIERADEPFATAARENGKKGGRPRKNQETTADGDTREDSLNIRTSDATKVVSTAGGNLESGTSATHYTEDAERGDSSDDRKAPPSSALSNDQETKAREGQRTGGGSTVGGQSIGSPVRSYRPRKVPHPKAEYEVFDFAGENGIPEWVANEFYQRFFVEHDGVDTDGNRIDNWKGALINYNKSRKRETA